MYYKKKGGKRNGEEMGNKKLVNLASEIPLGIRAGKRERKRE